MGHVAYISIHCSYGGCSHDGDLDHLCLFVLFAKRQITKKETGAGRGKAAKEEARSRTIACFVLNIDQYRAFIHLFFIFFISLSNTPAFFLEGGAAFPDPTLGLGMMRLDFGWTTPGAVEGWLFLRKGSTCDTAPVMAAEGILDFGF